MKKSVGEKSLGEKCVGEKCAGEKSDQKYMGETGVGCKI